jgi:hypothetical protein
VAGGLVSAETSVRLTDAELVWLTGHCRPEVQAEVDKAKARLEAARKYDLPHSLAGLVADVVSEATTEGRLVHFSERIRYCSWCRRDAGYYRYKSGYNRGQINPKKPLYFTGMEFARRFIRVRNHITLGACTDCVSLALPTIKAALVGVPVQLPPTLQTEGEQLWERHENRECTKCGWVGHEGEMGRRRTLMGDGTFPSSCPSCKAFNDIGVTVVKSVDGFVVAPVAGPEALTPAPPTSPFPAFDDF